MTCIHCGAQNDETGFCKNCGCPLDQTQPLIDAATFRKHLRNIHPIIWVGCAILIALGTLAAILLVIFGFGFALKYLLLIPAILLILFVNTGHSLLHGLGMLLRGEKKPQPENPKSEDSEK